MIVINNVVAADIMVKPVSIADSEETLDRLEQRFLGSQVSGMPVIQDGRLVGFISKTDLVRLSVVRDAIEGYVRDRLPWTGPIAAAGSNDNDDSWNPLAQVRVREAMHRGIRTCTLQTPIAEIASEMVQHRIHRLVVMDGADVVGIVSSLDLAKLLTAKSE